MSKKHWCQLNYGQLSLGVTFGLTGMHSLMAFYWLLTKCPFVLIVRSGRSCPPHDWYCNMLAWVLFMRSAVKPLLYQSSSVVCPSYKIKTNIFKIFRVSLSCLKNNTTLHLDEVRVEILIYSTNPIILVLNRLPQMTNIKHHNAKVNHRYVMLYSAKPATTTK